MLNELMYDCSKSMESLKQGWNPVWKFKVTIYFYFAYNQVSFLRTEFYIFYDLSTYWIQADSSHNSSPLRKYIANMIGFVTGRSRNSRIISLCCGRYYCKDDRYGLCKNLLIFVILQIKVAHDINRKCR